MCKRVPDRPPVWCCVVLHLYLVVETFYRLHQLLYTHNVDTNFDTHTSSVVTSTVRSMVVGAQTILPSSLLNKIKMHEVLYKVCSFFPVKLHPF